MISAETATLSSVDAAEVRARSSVDFDAVSSNVAAAAGTMTAACASDAGGGDILSWTYTVCTSAADGFASGQRRIEVFDISVDGDHGSSVTGIVTVAIIAVRDTAAETAMSGIDHIGKTTGKSSAGGFSNGFSKSSRPAMSPGKGDIDTDATSVANVSATSINLITSGVSREVTKNTGMESSAFRWRGDERKFSFIAVLVAAFYAVATVVAVSSMVDGSRDAIGYLASLFVFGSFGCKTMVPLRILALMSNVAFMTYAVRNQLAPVLVLHALLLPINIVRLWQIKEKQRQKSCGAQFSRSRA